MSTRSSTKDRRAAHDWMSQALELAREGMALAHPNPRVGAVIVKDGRKIGEGFHSYDHRAHAEIVALRQAGEKAHGATMYVTLEPCSHTGRTPPCAEAILAAGIRQVYAPMKDPNPEVAGRGFALLRRAGVAVHVGTHQGEAEALNEDFAKWIRTGLSFVTLKTALTLDGQIAARTGSATWLTSAESRESVQRLRHAADALLTGIGTILADDPRLTDRTRQPRRQPLLRVVADSRLRLPLRSKLVQSAQGDVLVFTAERPDSPKARRLTEAGIEIVRVPGRRGRVDLKAVLRELGERQILNLLLEAGAELNAAALQAGIVDKMILFYAPKIMGTGGVPLAHIPAARWFSKAPSLSRLKVNRSGPDFVVEGYFNDVYRHHRTRRSD